MTGHSGLLATTCQLPGGSSTWRVVRSPGRRFGPTCSGHAQSSEEVERWVKSVAEQQAGGQTLSFPAGAELRGSEPAVSVSVTTDSEGRFRIAGLGRDRQATLDVSGPAIAFRRVEVVTRRMKRVTGRQSNKPRLNEPGYHGADCTIVVEPGRPIEGEVRDAETKAPIPGAIITTGTLANSTLSIEGMITSVTDADGRYRLVGLPKGNGHRLNIYPPLGRPYFITDLLKVPAGSGLGPVPFNILLRRGIWITGRVTDSKTGQPVQSAIHYYPFLANTHAAGYPNFHSGFSVFWTGSRYRTDADGRYRVVGLPGRGIVAVKGFDRSYQLGVGIDQLSVGIGRQSGPSTGLPTYNQMNPREFQAVAEIDPPAGVEEFHRDFSLQPGMTLTVQVVDPEGKPLTQVTPHGRFPAGSEVGNLNLHDQTRFQVTGVDPTLSRTIVFEHQGASWRGPGRQARRRGERRRADGHAPALRNLRRESCRC